MLDRVVADPEAVCWVQRRGQALIWLVHQFCLVARGTELGSIVWVLAMAARARTRAEV